MATIDLHPQAVGCVEIWEIQRIGGQRPKGSGGIAYEKVLLFKVRDLELHGSDTVFPFFFCYYLIFGVDHEKKPNRCTVPVLSPNTYK